MLTLHWQVFLCALWILASVLLALYLIFKYEGTKRRESRNEEQEEEEDYTGVLYEDELWKTCCEKIHPAWLMGYRILVFLVLFIINSVYTLVNREFHFFYYSEWTSILITIYFLLGSLSSIRGCYRKVHDDRRRSRVLDEQHATDQRRPDRVAGVWGYIVQIIYQTLGGAIMLTIFCYWIVVIPLLGIKGHRKLFIVLQSFNLTFFVGEALLNRLRFPWFRIAYFIFWTCSYIVFQWIYQACIKSWWPPFLDPKYSFSPLWYFILALFLLLSYAGFSTVIKFKRCLLQSY